MLKRLRIAFDRLPVYVFSFGVSLLLTGFGGFIGWSLTTRFFMMIGAWIFLCFGVVLLARYLRNRRDEKKMNIKVIAMEQGFTLAAVLHKDVLPNGRPGPGYTVEFMPTKNMPSRDAIRMMRDTADEVERRLNEMRADPN